MRRVRERDAFELVLENHNQFAILSIALPRSNTPKIVVCLVELRPNRSIC